jgi:hypothetical protein
MIQEIIEYIKEHNLDRKSQKREIVYRRFYLFNLLRDQGLTLSAAGRLLDRDHSTALHGATMHLQFMEQQDPLYLLHIQQEIELFEPVKEDKRDIFYDILKAYNTTDLTRIKERILNNEYLLVP